jgi:hypothetical protein
VIEPSRFGAAKAILASAAVSFVLCGSALAASLQYQKLTLLNGWEQYSPQTGRPDVAIDKHNVVHLRGAINQDAGSASIAFILPLKYRPNRSVYAPVTMLNGAFGRLIIEKNGQVSVQAAEDYSDAQQFTSLEGVTFSKAAAPLQYSNIVLKNNWTEYDAITGKPAAAIDTNNVVHLKGAIKQTTGSIALAFTLAPKFRPSRDVYIHTNALLGRPARLNIHSNGDVFVQAAGSFDDAQAFTSLEGVSYSRN